MLQSLNVAFVVARTHSTRCKFHVRQTFLDLAKFLQPRIVHFATTFRRRRARARVRSCQNAIERWSQLTAAAAGEVSAPSSSCTAPATSSSAPWLQAATRSHHESREGRQMLLRPDEWRRAECWDRAGSAAVRLVSRAVQRTRIFKDLHGGCTVLNAGCAAGCPR